eukprot:2600668-Pleurochrysis_carterae.AAC.1
MRARGDQNSGSVALSAPQVNLQNSTEQPLKGRAPSESVAKTDSLEPRTPELTYLRPGGQEPTIIYKIQPSGSWEQAQARGLGRACAVAQGRALRNRRQPSRARESEILGRSRSASAPR